MCYAASCNPLCGQCRPKRIVQISCPKCNTPASITREEYLMLFDLPHKPNILEKKMLERGGVPAPICTVCGNELTSTYEKAVKPAPCLFQNVICGYPCGRNNEDADPDTPRCQNMVPLGRLQEQSEARS